MSPEFRFRKKETPNRLVVPVNWAYSKELIGNFIEQAYCAELNRTNAFVQKHREALTNLPGFIYSLGHPGRDLEGFNIINITPAKIRRLFGQYETLPYQFQAEMPLPTLVRQISAQIEKYIVDARAHPNEINFGASGRLVDQKIDVLNELAACAPDETITLGFKKDIVDGYKITQITNSPAKTSY